MPAANPRRAKKYSSGTNHRANTLSVGVVQSRRYRTILGNAPPSTTSGRGGDALTRRTTSRACATGVINAGTRCSDHDATEPRLKTTSAHIAKTMALRASRGLNRLACRARAATQVARIAVGPAIPPILAPIGSLSTHRFTARHTATKHPRRASSWVVFHGALHAIAIAITATNGKPQKK